MQARPVGQTPPMPALIRRVPGPVDTVCRTDPQTPQIYQAVLPPSSLQPGGRVGVHGMVVFGSPSTGLYMSHIPMYMAPHDMQAYLKVTFPTDRNFEDGLYTFEPKRCSLNDLLLGRLDHMDGTLYQGSFEGNGKPIGPVTVKVEKVVSATPLKSDTALTPDLEYQVVGTPQDAYLFHPLSKAPDFDHIVRLDLGRSTLSPDDIKNGVTLVFPGQPDAVEHRLAPGTVQATVKGTDRTVTVGVDRVLSALVGPDFTDAP